MSRGRGQHVGTKLGQAGVCPKHQSCSSLGRWQQALMSHLRSGDDGDRQVCEPRVVTVLRAEGALVCRDPVLRGHPDGNPGHSARVLTIRRRSAPPEPAGSRPSLRNRTMPPAPRPPVTAQDVNSVRTAKANGEKVLH